MTTNISFKSIVRELCLDRAVKLIDANTILSGLQTEIKWRVLDRGQSIRWPDFGTFYPKHRKAGRALDQSTKVWRPVKAQVTVGFKPAKASRVKL